MSLDLVFLLVVFAVLLSGYPVGIALGGVSMLFAGIAYLFGAFDGGLFLALPSRLFGVMNNPVLMAIPLFVFMGLVLDRSRIAADMLQAAAGLFKGSSAGLTISVTVVGLLLAASTGIVGASVVALGVVALPTLLRNGVSPHLASGTVAAAGTLGQIIPPSIVLIVLGDQMSNAWQKAQLDNGNFAPDTVSVADLFAGAFLPGLLLVGLYIAYQLVVARGQAEVQDPEPNPNAPALWRVLFSPLFLIAAVLGSMLLGLATATEAASVGAVGALLLAWGRLERSQFKDVVFESGHLTAMIFLIVIGASMFSLVFRGLGGEETITGFLSELPGGTYGALFLVMGVIFVLGFFLEFLEISFVVVPLVAPILLAMPMADGSAMSPVWLGVLIALNLQTSFLTPPFGVSLFYLRSVAPKTITTKVIYRGVTPFVALQLLALLVIAFFPSLATFLPTYLFDG
jgi:tripartite ATP-independent transporter DctM subunit